MGIECTDCVAGLDHCHGTLVLHDGGFAECAVAACDGDAVRHRLQAECHVIDPDCCVLMPEVLSRAS